MHCHSNLFVVHCLSFLTQRIDSIYSDILDSGPVAHGLNTGVWTSPLIAQIIHEEFGVSYHPGHVRHLLKGLNFSVQRPKTRLVQADPKKQNRWIRFTHPNLKKTPGMKAR
jgi:transposase